MIDLDLLKSGDYRTLARAITLVENAHPDALKILSNLSFEKSVPVLGITGPPGAGKSSLVNALVSAALSENMRVAVLAVDPSSPFNFGSLLGDRIRMAEHFNHPDVFIRSLASRGNLGGLSASIYEICDLIKNAGFDFIIIETVGVGQSEVEIAGIADTTAVVLVPEAGDEVQTLKSGLMEIADIFIVNKSDREGADNFIRHLEALVHSRPMTDWKTPVIKTTATSKEGIPELWDLIKKHHQLGLSNERKIYLMAEKAWHIIVKQRMMDFNREDFLKKIKTKSSEQGFNLYKFLSQNYFTA